MPDSAIVPSMATKPNGWLNNNSPIVTPIKPKGAVSNTKNTREKLFSCKISSVSTTTKNKGAPLATDALPLADSSTAPPVSMATPSGKLALISANFSSICAETTGACRPPRKCARTIMDGSRLRRQITPSSNSLLMVAICDSGTPPPACVLIIKLGKRDNFVRSISAPRTTKSIRSVPSLNSLTYSSLIAPLSILATSTELTPSKRALAWSIVTFITLLGSSQLSCTLVKLALARITSATWWAIVRIPAISLPLTRNCTGKPTGGPFSSRNTEARKLGKSFSNRVNKSLRNASRAAKSLLNTTNCAKPRCAN